MLVVALALASTIAVPLAHEATPVRDVPDPRPAHHVVDLTGTLTSADIAAIDRAARDASRGGELFVAVVPSTDGIESRRWATSLFNRMRLDPQARNRGVLLMAALADRKAEIVIGDGYPRDSLNETDRIMRDVVVERFKAGDARGAIVGGARELADDVVLAARTPERTDVDSARLRLPRLATIVFLTVLFVRFGVPFIRRYRPRRCDSCRGRMTRLSAADAFTHLVDGERAEERVGAAFWDVWQCDGCRAITKVRTAKSSSRAFVCPQCRYTTLVVDDTEPPAADGTVRSTCAHCGYTARVPRPTTVHYGPTHDWSPTRDDDRRDDSGGSSSGRGSSGSW